MKIYKNLKEAKESKLTGLAGIYYFKNNVTNQYYIGQAICIRKRFNTHYNLIINKKLINQLYKDIIELGLENFEYAILGTIKNQKELSKEKIKEELDKYEKYFIQKYNSYENGYNQTLGGDGGILGYKMTSEQIEIIRTNSKKAANDGRNTIYVYDVKEQKEYTFTSYTHAFEVLGVTRDCLYSAERRNSICMNRYIPRKTKEEIYSFLETLDSRPKNKGQFQKKLTIEQFKEILELHSDKTVEELCRIMGICKKTYYNYKKKL